MKTINFLRNYEPLPSLTDLNPGIEPGWKYGVLILQAKPREKTAGGLIIADSTKADEQLAAVEALIVDLSPIAFRHPDWPADAPRPYQPGDHVYTKKFPAGLVVEGADGREYMLISDDEIIGRKQSVAAKVAAA